ncbi:MAG: rod shape-determining protein RodA [Bdellovibrionales bacterium]|nr:rod shape-determining protein RodA [Bdellovibrionales bacterium]
MIPEVKSYFSSIDWILLLIVFTIPTIGISVLYSASYDPDTEHKFFLWTLNSGLVLRQLTYCFAGIFVMFVTAAFPAKAAFRLSYYLYVFVLLLLVAVLVYGTISNGSRRWLSLGPVNLQPSELMKIGVILALARYLSKTPPKHGVYGLTELFVPCCIFGIPMLVIMRQPDLGTALAVGAIGAAMVLFVGVRKWVLIGTSAIGVAGVAAAWNWFLHSYQKRRVLTLFDPESDPHGSGYQIIQSKIAVGSGELFGKGYLEGSQTRLEFIPERTTDFIFCVLAEEWGFIGSVLVISLYFLLFFRILQGVMRVKDYFSALVGVGVVALLFFHTFVNLGMVVGFLPVVGLPLPLFSYGGSSMLTTFFALGLVLAVTAQRSVFSSR